MINSIRLDVELVEYNVFECKPTQRELEVHLEPMFTDEFNSLMNNDLDDVQKEKSLSVNVSWLSECKNKLLTQKYILPIQNDTFTESTEDTIFHDGIDWLREHEKGFKQYGELKERSIDKHDLQTHIDICYGGNNSEFARACKVSRTQVNEWLLKDFKIINDGIFSKRRDLPQL